MFLDPERLVVKALGLEQLPAFVFIRVDGTVPAAAEGWSAPAWRAVAETVADATAWRTPDIPLLGDPGPFRGSMRAAAARRAECGRRALQRLRRPHQLDTVAPWLTPASSTPNCSPSVRTRRRTGW